MPTYRPSKGSWPRLSVVVMNRRRRRCKGGKDDDDNERKLISALSFARKLLPHLAAQQSQESQGAMVEPTVLTYPFGNWIQMLLHSLHHKKCLDVVVILVLGDEGTLAYRWLAVLFVLVWGKV